MRLLKIWFSAGLILVTSSFVTFWIEWNAEPARVTLGVTTMLNFFTTSNKYYHGPCRCTADQNQCFRFRSKLPVVSNLTAMNMWDGVCMFFIYASFIEFILVNYLARWVQDPEQQKKKRPNAVLDVRKSSNLTPSQVTWHPDTCYSRWRMEILKQFINDDTCWHDKQVHS